MEILYIASWWPNDKFYSGIFIKEHAKCISMYNKLHVLNVKFANDYKIPKKIIEIKEYSEGANLNIHEIKIQIPNYSIFYNKIIKKIFQFLIKYHYIKKSLEIIKSNKISIIHLNAFHVENLYILKNDKLNKLPFILTEHSGIYFPEQQNFTPSQKKTFHNYTNYWLNSPKFKSIVVVSDKLKETLQKDFLIKTPIFTIPNVVNIIKDYPSIEINPIEKIKIILIANWEYPKNLDLFIDTIKKLPPETLDTLEIKIGGFGSLYENLQQKSKSEILPIQFIGQLTKEEVYSYLSSSNLLIHPTDSESFSCIVAESISLGTPVLSNDTGAIKTMIGENAGIVAKVNDSKDFYLCFVQILENIKNNKYNRNEIKSRAKEMFSTQVIGKKFSEIYEFAIK